MTPERTDHYDQTIWRRYFSTSSTAISSNTARNRTKIRKFGADIFPRESSTAEHSSPSQPRTATKHGNVLIYIKTAAYP
jgi:hypothetical protein